MKITRFQNEKLQEEYLLAEHPSGLPIYICEKPHFNGAYAVFGTRYGSVDNAFRRKGEADFTEVPAGIAHFLEHKLFESEDGDAFARYAKTGASANAYTSFDRTCYLFSCTDHFAESFDILLDFVQHPYFTEQTVQKEQGIIGQEISMYDDSPDWVVLFNLLCCLYEQNPVRINIAGTAETISHITAPLLYRCYETFYNPHNMFLVAAGNVKAEQVLAACERQLKATPPLPVETRPYRESPAAVKQYAEQAMPVSIPQFAYGVKLPHPGAGYMPARERVTLRLMLAAFIGPQSPLYNDLLNEGLINPEFGGTLFDGRGFASLIFSGESRDPKALARRLFEAARAACESGLPEEEVELIRRRFYGRYCSGFDHAESIGDALTDCACEGVGLFDEADLLQTITTDEINDCLRRVFVPEATALSVIWPLGGDR